MNRILLGSAAFLAFAGQAIAADIEAPPAAYDWTGFYVGLQAGAAFTGSNEGVDVDGYNGVDGDVVDLDSETDFIGGVTVGYNIQIEQFVLGIEGDFSYWGYESSGDSPLVPFGADTEYKAEADWLGTIRARAGLAFDQSLVFVTGGAAYSDLEYSVEDDTQAPPGTNSIDASEDVSWGWTVGGGFEHAFDENMTVKIEYLYVHFGDETLTGNADVGGLSFDFDFDDTEIHIVRAGVNWRF